jgi:hypothetical protein
MIQQHGEWQSEDQWQAGRCREIDSRRPRIDRNGNAKAKRKSEQFSCKKVFLFILLDSSLSEPLIGITDGKTAFYPFNSNALHHDNNSKKPTIRVDKGIQVG